MLELLELLHRGKEDQSWRVTSQPGNIQFTLFSFFLFHHNYFGVDSDCLPVSCSGGVLLTLRDKRVIW